MDTVAPDSEAAGNAKAFGRLQDLAPIGPTLVIYDALRPIATLFSRSIDRLRSYLEPTPFGEASCMVAQLAFGDNVALSASDATRVIKLPPLAPGLGTPEVRIRYSASNWVRVPSQQFQNNSIYFAPSFYGYYQVFAPILDAPFDFDQVFVYPNPVPNGVVPTLHVEVGQADAVTTRIYDISGDLVFEAQIDSQITLVNGKPSYEYALDPSRFQPGVYVGVVTAEKAGKPTIRREYRFTIVK